MRGMSEAARESADGSKDEITDESTGDAEPRFDIAVVGAGPVGLALAGWLARREATRSLRLALIDGGDPEAARRDPRALALSAASRDLLEPIGWPRHATPIETVHVSQRGHFGRTVIRAESHGLTALGYVVRYGDLVGALQAGLGKDIVQFGQTRASAVASAALPLGAHEAAAAGMTRIELQPSAAGGHAGTLRARIVVIAEGTLGTPGQASGGTVPATGFSQVPPISSVVRRDFDQAALVSTVGTAAPQHHTAWERFTDEGPLALLPLADDKRRGQYALVWCAPPEVCAQRAAQDDTSFLRQLRTAFGERLGPFTEVGPRAVFPLASVRRDAGLAPGMVAIGNAAQTLHPVGGQGLNLGLRDARTLVESVARLGPSPAALQDFEDRRRLDRRLTQGGTEFLARIFLPSVRPLPQLRGVALTLIDTLPPLKHALARQMMFGQRR